MALIDTTAPAERDLLRAAALMLAPWLRHHSRCARVTEAGTCTCGLNDALIALRGDEIPTMLEVRTSRLALECGDRRLDFEDLKIGERRAVRIEGELFVLYRSS